MSIPATVTPNRRGMRSRAKVLDAAERLMAEHGYEAASLERIVREAGIPMSSVYHYFGSKDGILLAVMERGAARFFGDLTLGDHRLGSPVEHLDTVIRAGARALEQHPGFLRLMVVFAVQPPSAATEEVRQVVRRVRELALGRLREQIAIAFGVASDDAAVSSLAAFAVAAFDGAFVAWQVDHSITLEQALQPLALALVGAWDRTLRPA